MRKLTLKIKGMLRTSTHEIDVPEHYREMSSEQFHAICKLNRTKIPSDEFLCEFFGISHSVLARLDSFYIYMLTELIRGIKTKGYCNHFYDEKLKIKRYELYLPSMPSMPMMQFMAADTFDQWYQYTGDSKYLVSFASSVLLPKGVDFFEYDNKRINDMLQELVYVNHDILHQLEDLHTNWQFIKSYLADSYPNMFPAGEGDADGKKQRPGEWSEIFDSLVGEHLEHLETYKHLPAYDVFRIIDTRIREAKFRK